MTIQQEIDRQMRELYPFAAIKAIEWVEDAAASPYQDAAGKALASVLQQWQAYPDELISFRDFHGEIARLYHAATGGTLAEA